MTLKDRIIADMTAAMKAKQDLELQTLRMLKAEVMKYEVSGKDKVATDEVVVDLIQRGIKQRHEATEGFMKGGNTAAAEKEQQEIAILKAYLPEQMSDEDLMAVAREVMAGMSTEAANFGKVMGAVMARVKGKADGNAVSRVVKGLLG